MRVHRFGVHPYIKRMVLVGLAWAGIVSNPPAQADERGTAPAEAPRAVAVLEVVWPDHPEWLAMLADILQGSQLGPEDGWFRRAVAQTRFDWEGDPHAARPRRRRPDLAHEFAGPDADFARLDRDRDGVLTAADFDFSPHALTPSPGPMLVLPGRPRRQRQGDARGIRGVLRRSPTAAATVSCRSGRPQERHSPPPARPAEGLARSRPVEGDAGQGPVPPGDRLAPAGPELGEPAPDFTLKTRRRQGARSRSRSWSGRSRSCWSSATSPAARSAARRGTSRSSTGATRTGRRSSWSTSARRTRPTAGGWRATTASASRCAQPRSYDERVEVAQTCGKPLGPGLPDARRHDRRHRRRPLQRDAQPALPDRPPGQGRLQERRGPFGFKPASWSNRSSWSWSRVRPDHGSRSA